MAPQGIICVYPLNNLSKRIHCFNTIVKNGSAAMLQLNYLRFGKVGYNKYGTTSEELNDLVDCLEVQDLPLLGESYSYFDTSQGPCKESPRSVSDFQRFGGWLTNYIQHVVLCHVLDHISIKLNMGNLNAGPQPFRFFNV